MLDASLWTLAQDTDGAPPPNAPGGPVAPTPGTPGDTVASQSGDPVDPGATDPGQGSPFGGSMWIFLLLILVVMWVFMFSGQRKEKKKRAAMLAQMKKGNRIQTVGGILGTVVEVRDDEVIVKVDENANTRLRFARSAIQSVLDEPTDQE